MADNLKTTVKSVMFKCVNEAYFVVDFLPKLKKLLTFPHSPVTEFGSECN